MLDKHLSRKAKQCPIFHKTLRMDQWKLFKRCGLPKWSCLCGIDFWDENHPSDFSFPTNYILSLCLSQFFSYPWIPSSNKIWWNFIQKLLAHNIWNVFGYYLKEKLYQQKGLIFNRSIRDFGTKPLFLSSGIGSRVPKRNSLRSGWGNLAYFHCFQWPIFPNSERKLNF